MAESSTVVSKSTATPAKKSKEPEKEVSPTGPALVSKTAKRVKNILKKKWDFVDLAKLFMSLGMLAILLFSLGMGWATFFRTLGTALIIVLAASIVGGFLGFLFGIPRTIMDEPPKDKDNNGDSKNPIAYQANTNLEQISDWLTKIIIGIGLMQISKLDTTVRPIIVNIAYGFCSNPEDVATAAVAKAFTLGLVVYYTLFGFVFGYLVTRLYMARSLMEHDIESMVKLQTGKDLAKKSEANEHALHLAAKQLDVDDPGVPQEELNKALIAAAPETRYQIFLQARDVRRRHWRQPGTQIANTIPIFQALIHSEPNRYPYYGQLGYALFNLKDAGTEDLRKAEKALTHAIGLRNASGHQGNPYFEFTRAQCRIKLEDSADEKVRTAILADIEAVASIHYSYTSLKESDRAGDLRSWLRQHAAERAEELLGAV